MTLLLEKKYHTDQHLEATLVAQFSVQNLGQLGMQINIHRQGLLMMSGENRWRL
jgi:hypothetical protein